MLLLTRRPGESIQIGPNITVTVLRWTPWGVQIGISAPREIEIHREEVWERILGERAREDSK